MTSEKHHKLINQIRYASREARIYIEIRPLAVVRLDVLFQLLVWLDAVLEGREDEVTLPRCFALHDLGCNIQRQLVMCRHADHQERGCELDDTDVCQDHTICSAAKQYYNGLNWLGYLRMFGGEREESEDDEG